MAVVTAGAYVWVNGRIPFVLGPTNRGTLGIIRLGGHREGNETPWECATREVREEAALDIEHWAPPITLRVRWQGSDPEPERTRWQGNLAPLLVIPRPADPGAETHMYLATATGEPVPSAETKALILLTPQEVTSLCRETVTLRQFLAGGGQVRFRLTLDEHLPLEPILQLRLLAHVLHLSKGGFPWSTQSISSP